MTENESELERQFGERRADEGFKQRLEDRIEQDKIILEALKKAPLGIHRYLSTYCIHNLHTSCRLFCKICENPCVCNCHKEEKS